MAQHALKLKWSAEPPQITRGDATKEWRCLDTNMSVAGITAAPPIFHLKPFELFGHLIEREVFANIRSPLPRPPTFHEAIFILRSIYLCQELILSPYSSELDCNLNIKELEAQNDFGLSIKRLVELHRHARHIPNNIPKLPIYILYNRPNGASIACEIIMHALEVVEYKYPNNLISAYKGFACHLLSEGFLRNEAFGFITRLRDKLIQQSILSNINIYMNGSIPADAMAFFNQAISRMYVNLVEDARYSDIICEWTPYCDMLKRAYEKNKTKIPGWSYYGLSQGYLSSNAPLILYSKENVIKPVDGGAITYQLVNSKGTNEECIWIHFGGCPPSWDMMSTACATGGRVPFIYPKGIISASYVIISALCNEYMDPQDFILSSDLVRSAVVSMYKDFEVCEEIEESADTSCYIDVVVSPNIKSPTCAQVVAVSPHLRALYKNPNMREKMAQFALTHMQDTITAGTPTYNMIASHLFRWCLSQIQNPSEYELIATSPDPQATYQELLKNPNTYIENLTIDEIKFIVQHQPMFAQTRVLIDGLIFKIGGAHASLLTTHNNHNVAPLKRPPPDVIQKLDAENRGVSLATLYIDVPKEVSNLNVVMSSAPPSRASQILPITIPETMFPHPHDTRQHGSFGGLWGPGCYGCHETRGPTVALLQPNGNIVNIPSLVNVKNRLQSRAIGNHLYRADLAMLTCGSWYTPAIITPTEFDHLPGLVGKPPSQEIYNNMQEMVKRAKDKYGDSVEVEEVALKEAFDVLCLGQKNWRRYIDVRDSIVSFYREDIKRYLHFSDVQKQIHADHGYLLRVYSMLEYYGIINLQTSNVSGGVKGASFRPIAQGVARFTTSKLFDNKGNVKDDYLIYLPICEGCSRVQARKVASQKMAVSDKIYCMSCLACGNIPKHLNVDMFMITQINTAISPLEIEPLDGLHLDLLVCLSEAVERWIEANGENAAMGQRFWTSVSAQLIYLNECINNDVDVVDLPKLNLGLNEDEEIDAWIQECDKKETEKLDPMYCAKMYITMAKTKFSVE